MNTETVNRPTPTRFGGLPRAVWVGGGLLCLTVAALAGALVMKTVGPTAPTAANNAAPLALAATSTAPAPRPAAPVPPMAQQDEVPPPPTSVAAVHAPTPAPAIAAAPVPAAPTGGYAPAPAAAPTPAPAPARAAPAPCTRCGTVESVTAVKVKGQGTGVGAVAGGVLGGLVGNQVGHGNGRTAMTVLGAVGGGFAGNEVEKRVRSETLFDVRVRMRDGTRRTFRQAQPPGVGTRVIVDGNRLRIAVAASSERFARAAALPLAA